jgi:hypothetical protein
MQHDMGNDFESDDAQCCHGRDEHEEGAALFQGWSLLSDGRKSVLVFAIFEHAKRYTG